MQYENTYVSKQKQKTFNKKKSTTICFRNKIISIWVKINTKFLFCQ